MQRLFVFLLLFSAAALTAQTNRVYPYFPDGTVLHADVNYASDTLHKHLLDLYLPAEAAASVPLVV